ncbi:MAG: CBS domain-containing protein [Candidatus Cloacimonetes bacterium]|nr:CBS domain-containing protein [Candidatus Cloacimonadota bacterium]
MNVIEIMNTRVVTVSENMPILDARNMMMEEDITALPVVDKTECLAGIITQSDLFTLENLYLRNDSYTKDHIKGVKVKDVMTKNVITIDSSTTVEAAAQTVLDNHIHRLIVTDGQKVNGIISSTDILKAVLDK